MLQQLLCGREGAPREQGQAPPAAPTGTPYSPGSHSSTACDSTAETHARHQVPWSRGPIRTKKHAEWSQPAPTGLARTRGPPRAQSVPGQATSPSSVSVGPDHKSEASTSEQPRGGGGAAGCGVLALGRHSGWLSGKVRTAPRRGSGQKTGAGPGARPTREGVKVRSAWAPGPAHPLPPCCPLQRQLTPQAVLSPRGRIHSVWRCGAHL